MSKIYISDEIVAIKLDTDLSGGQTLYIHPLCIY